MNPHFHPCGRGTGQLCLPYPHPDMAEANVCFQASSKHPEIRLRKILPVPFKYSDKCQDKPCSGIKTRTICLWAQLIHNWKHTIPDTHLAHQLSSAPQTGTANPPYARYIQNRHIPAEASQIPQIWHNWGLQDSAYAHYTWVYLTSTVSATLASLLFLNTAQLPQAAITHWL